MFIPLPGCTVCCALGRPHKRPLEVLGRAEVGPRRVDGADGHVRAGGPSLGYMAL